MQRSAVLSAGCVALFLVAALGGLVAGGQPVYAAEPTASIKLEAAVAPTPVLEKPEWLSAPPLLSEERETYLDSLRQQTHLAPRLAGPAAPVTGVPAPETATRVERFRTMAPLAPDSASVYRYANFSATIPSYRKHFYLDPSVAAAGKYVFYTGNWFVARSTNGGATWQYTDPFADFPDFTQDQISIYDAGRNIFYWLRQGKTNAVGENVFKLGVSKDGGASFVTYTISPKSINPAWVNQWWDYPHIQLGSRYLYLTWNLFDKNNKFVRAVVLKFSLDALAAGTGFAYLYFQTDWFSLVPVQGADHIIYWASNFPATAPQNSRLAIFKHDELTTTVSTVVKTIATWNLTLGSLSSTYRAVCGATTGNWTGWYDHRLLTGARHYIYNKNIKRPGRRVLTWWWNVKQGGGFPMPYIDAASFYEDNLSQVEGWQGRPFIWNATYCYAYPSAAVNQRGDLGLILNYANVAPYNPSVLYIISDEVTNAPPPWSAITLVQGLARPPQNRYGDYNTVRPYYPSAYAWAAGAYYLSGTTGVGYNPIYFVFGRERDKASWLRWVPY